MAAPKAPAHGHGPGEPMSAQSLAIVFGVGAVLFWLVGAFAPASAPLCAMLVASAAPARPRHLMRLMIRNIGR